MSEDHGAIIVRSGMPSSVPYEAGQQVDTYVLLDPVNIRPAPALPPATPRIHWDAHTWAIERARDLSSDRSSGKGRELERLRCTCDKAPSLVIKYVDDTGLTWAIVGPERVPAAFRRDDRHNPYERAMPLHLHPDGTAHIELTSCRRCNQAWAIVLSDEAIQAARVRATRGAIVAP